MIIGFDAKRAYLNQTGLGNYSRRLIQSLAVANSQEDFHLYTTAKSQLFEPIERLANVHTHVPEGQLNKGIKSLWRSRFIVPQLVANGVQIYHGLSNEIPIGLHRKGIKSVVTIHDLIFLHFPENYPRLDRAIYFRKFKHAAMNADVVLATSMQTKNDIVSFFQVDPEKVVVTYQDCDEQFRIKATAQEISDFKTKHQLPEKFIISVGTIEKRKNQLNLLKAFAEANTNLSLVFVGKKADLYPALQAEIAARNLSERIHFPKVTFDDFHLLYQAADMLVYPSYFEGFGIPVLEGLRSGIPVITSNKSSLPEVGGDAAFYFDPNDVQALAQLMEMVHSDHAARNMAILNGFKQAENFDAHKIAQQVMDIYQSIL